MSSKAAEQDHSIEEILASIRQIISEDDQKLTSDQMQAVSTTPDAPEKASDIDFPLPPVSEPSIPLDFNDPMPTATAASPSTSDDDIFELVDRIDPSDDIQSPSTPEKSDTSSFNLNDLPDIQSVAAPSAPAPSRYDNPLPPLESSPSVAPESISVFTQNATNATLGAFSKLSDTILMERKRAIEGSTVTLEDIVKDLLQPLLREWIDHHVPGLVDRLVREELEKISRQTREN